MGGKRQGLAPNQNQNQEEGGEQDWILKRKKQTARRSGWNLFSKIHEIQPEKRGEGNYINCINARKGNQICWA